MIMLRIVHVSWPPFCSCSLVVLLLIFSIRRGAILCIATTDAVTEWFRWSPAKWLGYARESSNLSGIGFTVCQLSSVMHQASLAQSGNKVVGGNDFWKVVGYVVGSGPQTQKFCKFLEEMFAGSKYACVLVRTDHTITHITHNNTISTQYTQK